MRVLVLGGTRFIGAAIAEELHDQGHQLLLVHRGEHEPDDGAAVWNDTRRAADCAAVDTYRQALHEQAVAIGAPVADPEEPRAEEAAVHKAMKTQAPAAVAPPVQQVCPPTFGNSDIFGGTYPDPGSRSAIARKRSGASS